MLNQSRFLFIVVTIVAAVGGRGAGAFAIGQEVDFARDIWPIFETHCHSCHSGDTPDGQLRLDARQPFFVGGISGAPVVIPEQRHDKSEVGTLLERLTTGDVDQRMPLDEAPLSADQIRKISRWIDQGAGWPESVGEQVTMQTHWAYLSPVKSKLPSVQQNDWSRNAIDRFVLAKLEAFGRQPSAEANETKLVRRLYLDLIGLPPTVEQLDAYFAMAATSRYEQLVDQLLSSPRYGERWARPWLDAARYADSNGYQADQYREVWAYRDWVIRALNQDMPFDRFTIEQLAGDLLPNATIDQKIATGFQRLTTCNVEAGVDPEENRINQIVDRVNTAGAVWLGTTLECAQCHNHKYDPFSQSDYYALFAYFNQTPIEVEDSGNTIQFEFVGPKMSLPLDGKEQIAKQRMEKSLRELQHQQKVLRQELMLRFPAWVAQQETRVDATGNWVPFDFVTITSEYGTQFNQLEDLSFLAVGEAPKQDTYRVQVRFEKPLQIRAIRLETLTDDSLPGRGPGRLSAERPNFILNEFIVYSSSNGTSTDKARINWQAAYADFSQSGWPISATIDEEPATGWGINPQFHKDHWATFVPKTPIEVDGKNQLQIELVQQHGGARNIGRLRLLYSVSPEDSIVPLPAEIVAILREDDGTRSERQMVQLKQYFLNQERKWTELEEALEAQQRELQEINSPTTLVMVETESRETFVLRRGDFLTPGDPVAPGTPRVLPPLPNDAPANRLALAQWLVNSEQPLTSRVLVNRWWSEFFGRGIVATLEDFGIQGEPPTHPELLDWLAVELSEHGWSMKHIHRLIVTSATYRQTSKSSAMQQKWDPQNKWYGRGSRFRLPAETIRDNALSVSGLLSTRMFGEPVYPPQPAGVWRHVGRNAPKYNTSKDDNRFRRGIYVVWRRSAPYPSFVNFDAPDRASCVVQRSRTNTPLQALTLMNDPAYVEITRALARELEMQHRRWSDWSDLVRYAFKRCLAREPNSRELTMLVSMCEEEAHRWIKSNLPESEVLSSAQQRKAHRVAIGHLATVLMNLDETITRE